MKVSVRKGRSVEMRVGYAHICTYTCKIHVMEVVSSAQLVLANHWNHLSSHSSLDPQAMQLG